MGVNGQARLVALTPCVPLSRGAGEGERAAPLSHAVGEGLGVRAKKARLFSTQRTQVLYPYQLHPSPAQRELIRVQRFGAESWGQARLFALTSFVPLSREAGEGDYGVRKRGFSVGGSCASALQRTACGSPLSHLVGEGLG